MIGVAFNRTFINPISSTPYFSGLPILMYVLFIKVIEIGLNKSNPFRIFYFQRLKIPPMALERVMKLNYENNYIYRVQ
jgi:hypothetical protein